MVAIHAENIHEIGNRTEVFQGVGFALFLGILFCFFYYKLLDVINLLLPFVDKTSRYDMLIKDMPHLYLNLKFFE